jgi:ribosomal protein S6--L-glutamate ligase
MKIAILSRNPKLYSTRRLVEAGRARGADVQVLDTLHCVVNMAKKRPEVLIAGHAVRGVAGVVPRIGASITFYGLAVLRQFEMMGVFPANESQAIARSRDKLRSLQLFSRHDIGIPPTAFARSPEDIRQAIGRVGGAPVVLKLLEGTQGVGVILAESIKSAESVLDAMHSLKQNILIQKFVAEYKGVDFRAIVIDGRREPAAARPLAAAWCAAARDRVVSRAVGRARRAHRHKSWRCARARGGVARGAESRRRAPCGARAAHRILCPARGPQCRSARRESRG